MKRNIDVVHDIILLDLQIGFKQISLAINISNEGSQDTVHVDFAIGPQTCARIEASRSTCARF